MKELWRRIFILAFLPLGVLSTLYVLLDAASAQLPIEGAPAEVQAGELIFTDSGQSLGNAQSRDVALGDLDGDTDLDAFVANGDGPNRIWWNDGNGNFSGGPFLGTSQSLGVALGDLNGNDDLDAFVANGDGPNCVWLNNDGVFGDSGQLLGSGASNDVALGYLNDDSNLDAFVVNGSSTSVSNTVWINAGSAEFDDSLQSLGTSWSEAVALGDLVGDDNLDAFVANGSTSQLPDKVWENSGSGVFTDTGQTLFGAWMYDVALADFDGDKDLDAFTANWFPTANQVWENVGGVFNDTGQSPGTFASTAVALADLDGDDDIDALVGNWFPNNNEVWINNSGTFTNSGLALGNGATWAVALGDLDGDGDPDAFIANNGPNKVWVNGTQFPPKPSFDVDARENDEDRIVYPWALPGNATLPIMLSNPFDQPIEILVRVLSATVAITETVPFAPGEVTNPVMIDNPNPDPSKTLTLTLSINLDTTTGLSALNDEVLDELFLVFVDPDQGMPECTLCLVDWILKMLGFQPSFWALHHAEVQDKVDVDAWAYYAGIYGNHTAELSSIIAAKPTILWDAHDVLEEWTPAVQAMGEGDGDTTLITEEMAEGATFLLEDIGDAAGPELARKIEVELFILDIPSLTGQTMTQAADKLAERVDNFRYLPLVPTPP